MRLPQCQDAPRALCAQEAGPGRCLWNSEMRMYSSADRQGQSLFPLLFSGGWMRRGGKALPENNFHSNDGNAITQVKGIDLRHETPLARVQATGCFPRNLLSPSTEPSCPFCSCLPGFLLGKGRRAALPFSPSAPIKTVQQPQSPTRESFDSSN